VGQRLRIAIAGTGFGEKYAIGLTSNPDVEVVGAFSRRPERAAAMAERYGIRFSTHHFEELLELPGLDAVAVVTPNSTHAEFVRAAIAARKHVICDKPLALSAREGRELYLAAVQAGVRHVTFVPYRFSPAALALKEAMEGGRVGRVVSVRASWGVDLRGEPLRWRFQRKLSGAGVVADLGAHVFDLLMWWVGPIRRVLGRCRTLIPVRPAEIGGRKRKVEVPDECWALVEFARSGVGSLTLSWNARRDQEAEIAGLRGQLRYESQSLLQWLGGQGEFSPRARFVGALPGGRESELPLPGGEEFTRPEEALRRIFYQIVSYLRGGERPECVATFREGARVLRVIDAVEESSKTDRWVEVDGAAG